MSAQTKGLSRAANQRFVARRAKPGPFAPRAGHRPRSHLATRPQTRQGPVVSRPIQSHETCPANHGAVKRHGSAPREPPPPGCPRGSERLEAAPATPFAGTAIRTCLLFTMTSEQAHRTSPRRDPPGRKAVLSFPDVVRGQQFSGQRTDLVVATGGASPACLAGQGPKRSASQSSPREDWWSRSGSNRRPEACKATALPTELRPRHSGQRSRKPEINGLDRTANAVPRPVRQPCGSCHWGGPPACLAGQRPESQAHNEAGGPPACLAGQANNLRPATNVSEWWA
jgi:hypothetical protein